MDRSSSAAANAPSRPGRAVTGSLALLAGLFLAGSLCGLFGMSRASRAAQHATDIQLAVSRLLSVLVDAETGTRGFLATDDRRFLDIYDSSAHAWDGAWGDVKRLTADEPTLQGEVATLGPLIDERIASLRAALAVHARGGDKAAVAAAMLRSKAQMDAIRLVVVRMQAEAERLETERRRAGVVRAAWAAASFALATGLLAIIALLYWNERRRLVLLAEVQRERLAALEVEERFRATFENAAVGMAHVGLDLRWQRFNQTLCDITGYPCDELRQLTFLDVTHPDDVAADHAGVRRLLAGEIDSYRTEKRYVQKDGRVVWASVTASLLRAPEGEPQCIVTIVQDIDARKRAEEERQRLQAEVSREREEFVGILGHDLRNPLGAIVTAAGVLARRQLAPGDARMVARIASSAQRMANMVTQLLDLTRARIGGGLVVERRLIDLAGVASNVVEELRLVHPARELRCAIDPHVMGEWDPDRLAQVVSNLVGNALQHGDPARPVDVRLAAGEAEVTLEVHNAGDPIPPDVLPTIFDPYRQGTVWRHNSKGLGLGLFISQQIVHAHGGRIDVRSTAEDGTRFTVTLPRSPAHAAPGEPRASDSTISLQ